MSSGTPQDLLSGEEFKLNNGVTVVYEHTPHTQIATVQAWIKTGSANESAENNGISHFLEHILFKGTENYKPDEIDAIVDAAGGQMNAGTSKDYTMYYVTLPVEHAGVAFSVISDMVFKASFIPEEIEKEKPVVVQEIQRKYDNPTYEMWRDAMAEMYESTPYAMEIIGTEENVNSFTSEMLKDYYSSHYHPKNTTLVVVGDISKAQAKELAEKYFAGLSKIEPAEGYTGKWAPKPLPVKNKAKVYNKEVAQDYVLSAYRLPATAVDAPVYEVLTEILSGGEYSLLNKELKYDKGAVTAVSAGDMLSKNAGLFIVHMVTNPGDSEMALKALEAALDVVISGKTDNKELEKAKNRLKSRTVFMKERASSLASEIGYSYTLDIKDYYHTYTSRIDKITAEDVKTAALVFKEPAAVYITVPEAVEG